MTLTKEQMQAELLEVAKTVKNKSKRKRILKDTKKNLKRALGIVL